MGHRNTVACDYRVETDMMVCFLTVVDVSTGIDSESAKDVSLDVAGLHLLLTDSLFAKEFVPMVSIN